MHSIKTSASNLIATAVAALTVAASVASVVLILSLVRAATTMEQDLLAQAVVSETH